MCRVLRVPGTAPLRDTCTALLVPRKVRSIGKEEISGNLLMLPSG
jgi:hypothetical protein